MSILRFRITFEDYDDVHKDIDFEANHTFADLFNELLSSMNFDNKHKGEFFLADHNWRNIGTIGSMKGNSPGKLKKVELVDHIDDPHQKFLFVYDEEVSWGFQIELIRIIPSSEYKATYPKVASSFGLPPIQYKEELVIPTRDDEEDGRKRGSKKKSSNEEDALLALLGNMKMDDDEDEGSAAAEDNAEANIQEADLEAEDLETDSEISKMAEEFDIDDVSGTSDYDDDDSEYGNDDEEYNDEANYEED